MHTRPQHTATIVVAVCAALAASGCTLIGLGIGALNDSRDKKLQPAPAWRVTTVGPGTRIALDLADGRRLEGELDEIRPRKSDEYAPAYEAARLGRPRGVDLPELGRAVLLGVAAGPEQEVEWVGIDLTGIVVRRAEMRTTVPFDGVGALRDGGGRIVSGPVLQKLAQAREVPLLSTIVLKGVEPVPADHVVQIEVASSKKPNGKLVGALVGFAIDAIVVAYLAANPILEDDEPLCGPDSPPGCSSCPFVFSFDGKQYVRDAEVLGSATLESAQHTDRVALGRLAEVDGDYRLRVANELREIDAIDALRLVVADAPPGTRVAAAPDGRLIALADPAPPRRVLDLRGHDVTRLLRATDGTVWFSNPQGRDPERRDDLRDGLVLDFERPTGADSVTVAFHLRSTTWAVQLLAEALALHGRELPAWRARVNGDPGARAAFFGALRREVLPAISVWDGERWRPVGVLSNLGPWLDREQAVRISLQGTSGPTLRVRLESTPGLWIVDSVMADFGTPPAIDVVVLTPRRADFRGQDVRGPLSDRDGRRVMLEQGDSIEMVFGAPPAQADRSRSVFVEATGYYTPLVPADGAPRPELFEELVAQPGAIASWSLRMFAEESALARSDAMRPTSGASQER